MAEKVIITSDSTTDLSPELREKYNIQIMPLVVSLNDVNHLDGVDITPEDETNKTLPKTAAPNLADCTEFFRQWVEQGYSVVHFTISSEMSSTYQNSVIAAEDFENVYVVDTRNLSTGGGLLVIHAAELAQRGLRAGMIAEECRRLAPCVDASFVIDSLEFLYDLPRRCRPSSPDQAGSQVPFDAKERGGLADFAGCGFPLPAVLGMLHPFAFQQHLFA